MVIRSNGTFSVNDNDSSTRGYETAPCPGSLIQNDRAATGPLTR